MFDFNICRVRRPDGSEGFVNVVTLLPQEAFLTHGLAGEAIAGSLAILIQEAGRPEHLLGFSGPHGLWVGTARPSSI
jgi:hypothetical protein